MSSGLQHVKNMKRMAVIGGEVVPGRDLTADEVKHFGRQALIASGLYQPYKAATVAKKEEPKQSQSKKEKGD